MRDPEVTLAPAPAMGGVLRLIALQNALRARLRVILLVVLPLVATAAGLAIYLQGGRYISTDNAYVGAEKVLITPEISGKIAEVEVREGQRVRAGDVLLRVDAEPYRLTLMQAQAKLASVRIDFTKLKADYQSLNKVVELSQQSIELKQRDVERKKALLDSTAGSPANLETAISGMVTQQLYTQLGEQQRAGVLAQLSGNPDLPIEQFPPFIQAQAAVAQAQRDLDHAVVRAPIDGTATQVDNIQLGRFVAAGTPLFSVIDDTAPWVDANPKETDITYLRVGQKATIDVDTFPGHTFTGTVTSVSPGTGAQFAILPPQNANGNWVKVVQRVPVRIAFDRDEATRGLRAGMSVTVDIDTHRTRTLAKLVGLTSQAEEPAK